MASRDDPTGGTATTHKYAVNPDDDAEYTNTAVSAEWRWRHERGNPRITTHCQERWDERTPPGAVAPETAWEYGVGVGDGVLAAFADQGGQTPDEMRLYHGVTDPPNAPGEPYTMLFIVCGTRDDDEYHARTVYPVGDVVDPRMRMYLAVVEWQAANMHGDDDACDTPTQPVFDGGMVPAAFVEAWVADGGGV